MKKLRVILIFCTIALLLFACSAEKHYNEWVKQGNDYYYYASDGNMVCDTWKQEGSDWYYLAKDGKMLVNNWLRNKDNGKNYFFDIDGKMIANCQREIGGVIYIFDAEGDGKVKPDINVVIQGLNKYMYADYYYISIDDFTYDIKKMTSEKYGITFNFSGTVLKKIETKYTGGLIDINYKIIDSEGYVVNTGFVSCAVGAGKSKGEKFKFSGNTDWLKKGDYVIQFIENKRYGNYY